MPALRNALSSGLAAGGGGIEALMEQLRRQLGGGGGGVGTAPGGSPPPPSGPDPGGSGPFYPGAPQAKPKGPEMNGPPFNPNAPTSPLPPPQKPDVSLDEQTGQKPGGGGQQLPPGAGGPRPKGPGQTLPGTTTTTTKPVPPAAPKPAPSPALSPMQQKLAATRGKMATHQAGGNIQTSTTGQPYQPPAQRFQPYTGPAPGAGGAPGGGASLPPPGSGGQPFVNEGFGRPGQPIQLPNGGTLTIPPEGLTQPEYDVLSGVRAGNSVGGPNAQRILDGLVQRGVIAPGAGGGTHATLSPGGGGPTAMVPPGVTSGPVPGGGQEIPGGPGGIAGIRAAMPPWMAGLPGVTTEVAMEWARKNPTMPGAAELMAAAGGGNSLSLVRGAA